MEYLADFAMFMVSMFLLLLVIATALAIMGVVGSWKILSKAKEPGWAALIPIYSQYMLCKIAGINPYWLLIVILSPLLGVIPIIGGMASVVASIYFLVLLNVSLARSFGKDDGFAIGLILLNPIFYLILGLDKSEYLGPKPMDDIIFGKNGLNIMSNSSDDTAKYCTSCGAKLTKEAKFCPYCGKESK